MKQIVLLIICVLLYSDCLFAQDTTAYLAKNYCSIDENKESTDALSLFEEDILTKQVFTFGETHKMKGNSNIYKALFIALHQRGIKHIVFELPFGWNYLVKNYLATGDSVAYDDLQKVMIIGADWMEFFEWVYKYNTHLSSAEKITIDFIDIEGEVNYNPSMRRLQILLSKDEPPPVEIRSIIKKTKCFKQPYLINKRRKFCKKRYKRIAKELYESVNNNDKLYKNFLKENYDEFKKTCVGYYLANYQYSFAIPHLVEFGSQKMRYNREKFMYNRYIDLLARYKNEKIFSVHGKMHLYMPTDTNKYVYYDNNTYRLNRLADTLNFTVIQMLNVNKTSPVKGKICSIGIDYSKKNWGSFIEKNKQQPFLKLSNEPLTLFKLNGENTPFKKLSQTIQYLIIDKY